MNEKMRGINIQEKASMCGKCKMWLVMVVFALISTAMLSSVKIHAASAEENQMVNVEKSCDSGREYTGADNGQYSCEIKNYWKLATKRNIFVSIKTK